VFGSVVPVVCGVGHEQDETIADYVADLRASTPSNAAELIAPHRQDIVNYVDSRASTMTINMEDLHEGAIHNIDSAVASLDSVMTKKVSVFERTVERMVMYLKFFQERITMHTMETISLLGSDPKCQKQLKRERYMVTLGTVTQKKRNLNLQE